MSLLLRSTQKTVPALLIAVWMCCLAFVGEARAVRVTFSYLVCCGTITAVCDGKQINSGESVSEGAFIKFTAIPQNGYGFDRWWQINDGDSVDISFVKEKELLTQAQASKEIDIKVSFYKLPTYYTVKFNANGGTVFPDSVTIEADGTLDYLPVPARPGYAFEGWYTAPTGGTKVETDTKIPANTTIYAHWKLAYVTVIFSAGVGGGTLTATVKGVPIASGDSVAVGKDVVFTAVPDDGYNIVRWTVNGAETVDTSSTYALVTGRQVPEADTVEVTVSFEMYAAAGAVMKVGPNLVKAGGRVTIYWLGGSAVSGSLSIFDAVGNKVSRVNVSGLRKIGTWKAGGLARGTYLIKGVLKDKDGNKIDVAVSVGVVR